ncbi:hypothetical protein PMAYCL1PPCAC_14291, partial [Pristionchus mayeri]
TALYDQVRLIIVKFTKSELVFRYLIVVLLLIILSVKSESTRTEKVDSIRDQSRFMMIREMLHMSIGRLGILL